MENNNEVIVQSGRRAGKLTKAKFQIRKLLEEYHPELCKIIDWDHFCLKIKFIGCICINEKYILLNNKIHEIFNIYGTDLGVEYGYYKKCGSVIKCPYLHRLNKEPTIGDTCLIPDGCDKHHYLIVKLPE